MKAERTKQMEPILRVKVKIFSKVKILIKNDGHIGFDIRQEKFGVAVMI